MEHLELSYAVEYKIGLITLENGLVVPLKDKRSWILWSVSSIPKYILTEMQANKDIGKGVLGQYQE